MAYKTLQLEMFNTQRGNWGVIRSVKFAVGTKDEVDARTLMEKQKARWGQLVQFSDKSFRIVEV